VATKQHTVEWKLKLGTEGSESVTRLRTELDKLGKIASFGDLKKDVESAEAAWKTAQSEVAALAREIKAADAPTKKLNTQFERAQATAGRLKADYEKQRLSLHNLRSELATAGVNTTKLGAAQRTTRERVKELQAQVDKSSRRHDLFKRSLAGVDKASQSVRVSVARLVGAYVGLNAVRAGGSMLVQSLRNASTSAYALESSVQAANREFGNGVGTMAEWTGKLQILGDELKIYSNSELRNAASRTIDMTKRLGLSVDQMATVIERAGNMGAGKTDLEGSVERITSALRGEAEAAEFLGLTLNEDYVKGWYAAHEAHEKAWKDLTDIEKAQVRYKVMLEQTNGASGRAAGTINTMDGALQYMLTTIDNTIESNGDLKESIKDMAKTLGDAAPDIAAMAASMVDLLASVSSFAASVPDGTSKAVATGLIVKWLLGAVPEETLAMLRLTAGQIAAIAAAYAFLEHQATKYGQVTEDSWDWVKNVNAGVRELFETIGLSNRASVEAGLRRAVQSKKIYEQDAQRIKALASSQQSALTSITTAEAAAYQKRAAISNRLAELKDANWDEIEKSVKNHLKDMLREEERYAERVQALDERRKLAQLSGEEKIRAMLRTTMSDYDQYVDKQDEANESLQKAYAALSSGDGEQAQFWAEKAADQFADLNAEVKDGERVIVSAAQAQATAVEGVRAAYEALDQAYQAQVDREVAGHKERQQLIEQDKRTLQDIKTIQGTISDVQILISTQDGATPTMEKLQEASAKLSELNMNITATDNASEQVRLIDAKTGELLDDKAIKVTANDQATGTVRLIETQTGLLLTNKSMDVTVQDKATEQVRLIETESGLLLTNKAMEITAEDNASSVIQDVAEDVVDIPAGKTTEVTAEDNASAVLNSIKSKIDALHDKTITITTRYRTVRDGGGYEDGGRIPGYAFGGRLPGYSLRDNLLGMIRGQTPIALAGGEFVTTAPATRAISQYAPGLLEALNRVRTQADMSRVLAKLSDLQGLASGGRVSESYRVTLAAGGSETTITTGSRPEYDGVKAFTKALNRERLRRGE
jgi:hypothetical protein